MKFDRCFGCMEQVTAYPCPKCSYTPEAEAVGYALRPGTILNGKFMVGRVLGQGGFGITYIGWDLALARKVAIKEYFPSGCVGRRGTALQWYGSQQAQAARSSGMEIFLKEARKMSRVGNIPEVVQVRDLFQENETAYIVMDFIEGQTLMAWLRQNGPVHWDQAKDIFLPAIRAMEQVHQAGLIHRDLSPDNLMLVPDGSVKILDLGAAKDLNINPGVSSMQVAKTGFSPLEQYTQQGGSGPWTDVYSMAATIFYALTAVVPPSAVDRMDKETMRWDTAGLLTVPPNVTQALKQALAIQVDNRTRSMAAFAENLQNKRKPFSLKRCIPLIAGGAAALLALIIGTGALADHIGTGAADTLSDSFSRPTATPDVEANILNDPDYASMLGANTDNVYTFTNGVQASMYFDEEDLERCRVYTNKDGQRLYIFTAEYDADGNMIQQQMYDGDGAVQRVDLWEYTDDGKCLSHSIFDADMARQNLNMWAYDEQGRDKSFVYEDADGNVLRRGTSTYDSIGTETYTWKDIDGTSGTTIYDTNGNPVESIYLDQDGNQDQRYVYFYDSTGKQIEQQHYDDKDLLSSRYEYKYQGNLLLKELSYSGNGSYSSTNTKMYGPHDVCFGNEYEDKYSHNIIEYVYSIGGDLLQHYETPAEVTDYSSDSVNYYTWTYTWMEVPLLGESYNMDGSLSGTVEFHFDENGAFTGTTHTNYSPYSDIYVVTEHDADNNAVSSKTFDLDDNLVSTTECEYNGSTCIEREFDTDGTLIETAEIVYTEYGDMLSSTSYNPDGDMLYKCEYHYDSDGRKTGYTLTHRSSQDGTFTVTEYDADGNIVSEKKYDPDDEAA